MQGRQQHSASQSLQNSPKGGPLGNVRFSMSKESPQNAQSANQFNSAAPNRRAQANLSPPLPGIEQKSLDGGMGFFLTDVVVEKATPAVPTRHDKSAQKLQLPKTTVNSPVPTSPSQRNIESLMNRSFEALSQIPVD